MKPAFTPIEMPLPPIECLKGDLWRRGYFVRISTYAAGQSSRVRRARGLASRPSRPAWRRGVLGSSSRRHVGVVFPYHNPRFSGCLFYHIPSDKKRIQKKTWSNNRVNSEILSLLPKLFGTISPFIFDVKTMIGCFEVVSPKPYYPNVSDMAISDPIPPSTVFRCVRRQGNIKLVREPKQRGRAHSGFRVANLLLGRAKRPMIRDSRALPG